MTPAEIRERITESRRAQGLHDHVVDPLLDALAREVLVRHERVRLNDEEDAA